MSDAIVDGIHTETFEVSTSGEDYDPGFVVYLQDPNGTSSFYPYGGSDPAVAVIRDSAGHYRFRLDLQLYWRKASANVVGTWHWYVILPTTTDGPVKSAVYQFTVGKADGFAP